MDKQPKEQHHNPTDRETGTPDHQPRASDLLLNRTFRKTVEKLTEKRGLGLLYFRPRPDRPADFDEQASFVFSKDIVSFFLKGNAAGGTEAAAYKAARFLLQVQPPPRFDTPFWVISDKYDQCINVCWKEKFYGHGYIPDCEIDWGRVQWKSTAARQPFRVPLRPWPEEAGGHPAKNWLIEFKSYQEGREMMQAASLGGAWFSEQFPQEIFTEVFRGCRDYLYPGSIFAEFTPIKPELCVWLKELLSSRPRGWGFYRGSTFENEKNLAPVGWRRSRQRFPMSCWPRVVTGGLPASRERSMPRSIRQPMWFTTMISFSRFGFTTSRAIDWGDSEKHPTTCVWGCHNDNGDWYIYDEYWSNDQTKILIDHAVEILLC